MAESFLLTSAYPELGQGFPECTKKYMQKPQVSCVLFCPRISVQQGPNLLSPRANNNKPVTLLKAAYMASQPPRSSGISRVKTGRTGFVVWFPGLEHLQFHFLLPASNEASYGIVQEGTEVEGARGPFSHSTSCPGEERRSINELALLDAAAPSRQRRSSLTIFNPTLIDV